MDVKEKEAKLRQFALSILNDQEHKQEIDYILSKLKLSKEKVIQAYIKYDIDIFAYENEIYESLDMRAVLYLHNLLKGSWHQERQQDILDMLKNANPKSIVDMGFGVPTKYIREYILKQRTKLVLVDLYDSAFQFSKILLDYLYSSWKEFISFKKLDMNTHEFVGKFDCYIFQDSIEHVKNATEYLSKTVKFAPKNSKFILSLPVGPCVPVHTISWKSNEEVKKWLNGCGLKINKEKEVYVNPKVDLFAEQVDKEFYNLIVLCNKE